jgi:4-amino-4-deoxy-L-arabinose transferase-like glycosyltransferase
MLNPAMKSGSCSTRTNIQLIVLFLAFLLLRLYGITEPLVDMHNVRQTQTAMIARNLLTDNFNILYTRVDWEGDKRGIVVQEFPLYQLIVALTWKIIGRYDIIGRLVSLLFSIIAVLYLFKIARLLFNQRIAYYAVLFFGLCPIAVFMSRSFMINMLALSFSLVGLFYWVVWSETKRICPALHATFMLTLAALINLTTILPVAVVIGYIALKRWENNSRTLIACLSFATVFLGGNLLWNLHAAHVNAIYYPQWSGTTLLRHFLGLEVSRLDLYKWYRITIYFVVFVVGIHGAVLFLSGLRLLWRRGSSGSQMLIAWLLGGVLYCLVFFNALAGHNYYLLPVVPVAGIVVAISLDYWVAHFRAKPGWIKKTISVLFVATLPLWLFFPIVHSTEKDDIAYEAGLAAREHSQENDLILVAILHTNVASSVYPTILYYADRQGWNVMTSFDPYFDQQKVDSLSRKGAKLLVLTYGKESGSRLIQLFPLHGFSHEVKIDASRLVKLLKSKYAVVEERNNYIVFKLS